MAQVADAPWPKVVVSGVHDPAQEAVSNATAMGAQGGTIDASWRRAPRSESSRFNEILRRVRTS